MSSSNKTLTEQVKEAERDKLIAEKKKIEIEIAQSKLLSKKNIITILTSAFIGITIAWFYYEKIEKFVFDTNSIMTAHDNALKTAALDSGIRQLGKEKKIVKEDSIKYVKLLNDLEASQSEKKNLNIANNSLTAELQKTNYKIKLSNDSLRLLRDKKNRLQPIVDSLQNESYINSVDSKFYVYFHFKIDGKDVNPSNVIALTKNNWSPSSKPLIFRQTFLPGRGREFTMYLFRGCQYVLKMSDSKLKFKNDVFEFQTSDQGELPEQTIEVPVVFK